jgi:hypothetical protein
VPGLTLAKHGLKRSLALSGDGSCVWADSVQADFSYETIDVYVSSEYGDGSCEKAQLYRHELDHVEVHRRLHAKYSAELKAALQGAVPTRANPAAGQAKLIDKVVDDALTPVYRRFQEELAAEQAKLDTPGNYLVLQSACPGWR